MKQFMLYLFGFLMAALTPVADFTTFDD